MIWVQFANNWFRNCPRLTGKDDQLVILTQVAQEVINARSLRHPPSVLSCPFAVNQKILHAQNQGIWAFENWVWIWQKFSESWLVVIIQLISQSSLCTGPHQSYCPS